MEEFLIQYQKPVTIHPAGCGELLDKSLGSFDGTCQWNGEECLVHLDVDEEDAETAEDAPEITKEDFARRLSISELGISTDGEFEIYYNDNDMFWGYVIIVSGNLEEGLDGAMMAG